MASINWVDAHAAVVSWIKGALSDVPDLAVLWGYQSGVPFPAPPVVVPHFLLPVAEDKGTATEGFDEDAAPGAEVTTTTRRTWLATLVVSLATTNANVTGASSPHALVSILRTYLRDPNVLAALLAAGLAYVDEETIDEPPELFKNTWQPEAWFAVRFRYVVEVTSTTGYFATAEMTAAVDGNALPALEFQLGE